MKRGLLKKDNILISDKIDMAETLKERVVGLMFKQRSDDQYGLYIPRCKSVHTFFMKYTLDLVFTDSEFNVVKTVKNLKPWRLSPLVFNAYGVVEFPAGVIEELKIDVGDKLELETE